MKKAIWLEWAAFLLIGFWFFIGIWLIANSQEKKLERRILPITFPVEHLGSACTLTINEGALDLILPQRLPAGKGDNSADLVINPAAIPFQWQCPDPAAEAIFEESLRIYLSARFTLPEAQVSPADRIAQPLNDSFAKRFRWEFELSENTQDRKAEIWIGVIILSAETPIHNFLNGSVQPTESWLWTLEQQDIRAFSVMGITYHHLIFLMFIALGLGIFMLLLYGLIYGISRKRAL